MREKKVHFFNVWVAHKIYLYNYGYGATQQFCFDIGKLFTEEILSATALSLSTLRCKCNEYTKSKSADCLDLMHFSFLLFICTWQHSSGVRRIHAQTVDTMHFSKGNRKPSTTYQPTSADFLTKFFLVPLDFLSRAFTPYWLWHWHWRIFLLTAKLIIVT